MYGLIRPSYKSLLPLQICFKSLSISSVKKNIKDKKTAEIVNKILEKQSIIIKDDSKMVPKIWDEKREVKRNKPPLTILPEGEHPVDLLRRIQGTRNFPVTLLDWVYYFKRKQFRKMMYEQQFLPRRHAILKPDLAAAHFILGRGGAIKFTTKDEWLGEYEGQIIEIPITYIPGYYVEGINAEGTGLYYEGLKNLCRLRRLKWLSLKGLKEMDDWCLDYVSKEFYKTLEYLDISDCPKITYRGLSSFYRFEELKTLIVKGIPDTIEFKLACIMLQDIMPELKIEGINLNVPEKIDPVDVVDVSVDSSGKLKV